MVRVWPSAVSHNHLYDVTLWAVIMFYESFSYVFRFSIQSQAFFFSRFSCSRINTRNPNTQIPPPSLIFRPNLYDHSLGNVIKCIHMHNAFELICIIWQIIHVRGTNGVGRVMCQTLSMNNSNDACLSKHHQHNKNSALDSVHECAFSCGRLPQNDVVKHT